MAHTEAGCQILVVEDSPEVSEAFSILLREEGYRVATTANGLEALILLRHERPQLVFVDLVMPLINGFQLIEYMKRDDELAKIPVVAVTASTYRVSGITTVKKPFVLSGLLEAAKLHCKEEATASSTH
ncbi:MAG TPA: response regulator [Polyangiaceae bacterium]